MYKKIYGTSSAELSTIINVGGIPRRIEFTGGVPSGVSRVSARFGTSDKRLQDAIECKRLSKYIFYSSFSLLTFATKK